MFFVAYHLPSSSPSSPRFALLPYCPIEMEAWGTTTTTRTEFLISVFNFVWWRIFDGNYDDDCALNVCEVFFCEVEEFVLHLSMGKKVSIATTTLPSTFRGAACDSIIVSVKGTGGRCCVSSMFVPLSPPPPCRSQHLYDCVGVASGGEIYIYPSTTVAFIRLPPPPPFSISVVTAATRNDFFVCFVERRCIWEWIQGSNKKGGGRLWICRTGL